MSSALRFADSAVSAVIGNAPIMSRNLDQMSVAELEARAKLNEERLRLVLQASWLTGFGSGFFGAVSVAKMMK
jgi:hypothetical protein